MRRDQPEPLDVQGSARRPARPASRPRLCDAHTIDLSAHCASTVSAHVCAAQWHFRHIEFFHDHARIERMLFDGRPDLVDGCLVPDRSRPGLGLELRRSDAAQYQVFP